ncbi:MAG: ABC transporter ATP-binding protein [Phycisphaerae bacterium]
MIRVNAIRKAYGDLVAVAEATFEIRRGETFGLLGPNGAGKTTTIHMLVGAQRPDAGTIELDGLGAPTSAAARAAIGIAPQSLSLYEELSATENIEFFGRMYGLSGGRLRQRVAWGLEFAGLTDRRGDRVKTFSGGMKRRLNLACALAHEPRMLLLDEPTVGVDPQSRNHIFEGVERLKADGCTILYTTHYMEEAARLCDRVAIMDHGRVLALDAVPTLIAQHGGRSVITAELTRPPPQPAALPGRVEGTALRCESTQPFETLGQLTAAGVSFSSLRIDQPDLETVFLTLTGRSLRD